MKQMQTTPKGRQKLFLQITWAKPSRKHQTNWLRIFLNTTKTIDNERLLQHILDLWRLFLKFGTPFLVTWMLQQALQEKQGFINLKKKIQSTVNTPHDLTCKKNHNQENWNAKTLTYSHRVYWVGIAIIVTVVTFMPTITTGQNIYTPVSMATKIYALLHGCLKIKHNTD